MKNLILLSASLLLLGTACKKENKAPTPAPAPNSPAALAPQPFTIVPNGSFSKSGNNADIYCTVEYNGALYIGGDFSIAGGIVANNIVKWDGTNWFVLGSGLRDTVSSGAYVSSMCVYNGELYVSGNFSSAGGVSCSGLAKWNGTSWSVLPNFYSHPVSYINGSYNNLIVFNNKLVIGGKYTWNGSIVDTLTNTSRISNGGNLVIFNGNLYGSISFGNGLKFSKWNGLNWIDIEGVVAQGNSNQILSVLVFNNELYVNGDIKSIGGIAINNQMAKWNGASWSTVNTPQTSATPTNPSYYLNIGWTRTMSMCVYNNCFYINEMHNSSNTTNYTHGIAKWDGTNWSQLGKHNDPIYHTFIYNNLIFAFSSLFLSSGNGNPQLMYTQP